MCIRDRTGTIQRWYSVFGKAAAIASLIPVKPSAQMINTSLTPRFFSSDVYKRQIINSCKKTFLGIGISAHENAEYTCKPVSYTHLDVYKRQMV